MIVRLDRFWSWLPALPRAIVHLEPRLGTTTWVLAWLGHCLVGSHHALAEPLSKAIIILNSVIFFLI